jgi:hypothetical protein
VDVSEKLGSIDSELKSLNQRFDRLLTGLYGPNGMEKRLRGVENKSYMVWGAIGVLSFTTMIAIAYFK